MKRIIFCSTFRGPSGYSVAARSYLKCLDSYLQEHPDAFELKLHTWNIERGNISEQEKNIIDKYEFKNSQEIEEFCKKEYETLFFLAPNLNIINATGFGKIMDKSKKNTSIVVWETQKVPNHWLDSYKKYFSQIIVPCDWNKQVFGSQTGLPTYKIPYLIDFAETIDKKTNNIFNIISMSQWTPRKGFDLLIKAYCSEFYHQEDVLLTIKTYGHGPSSGRYEEDRNSIINGVRKYKNSINDYYNHMKCKINVITGVIPKPEVDRIFDNSHLFCLPTRGEGFGLTIAEALSREVPVMVPNKGGHIDYIHKNNFFVDSKFMTSTDMQVPEYSSVDMKLVETDLDDLRSSLRKAYELWKEDPKQLQAIGIESRKFLQEYCNPEKITQDLVKILIN